MLRFQILTLCAVYAGAADPKVSITTTSTATKLEVDGKDTGCTTQTFSQDLTCTEDAASSDHVPAKYFTAFINCKNMGTSPYHSFTVEPSSQCAQMVFKQHKELGQEMNLNTLEMEPNSVANFTCVVFPFKTSDESADTSGWVNLPVTATLTGITKSSVGTTRTSGTQWTMGSVRFTAPRGPYLEACRTVVQKKLQWGLSLLKSTQNVHELLWTSQAEKPDIDLTTPETNIYASAVTKTVKKVGLKDLKPSIASAYCSTGSGSVNYDRNFADQVKLKTFEASTGVQLRKVEEKLELSVDATQIPKSTKELEVTVALVYPVTGLQNYRLMLPVDNPELPDEEPTEKPAEEPSEKPSEEPKPKEKSDGVGAGVIAFIVIFAAGAVVAGAFFYRRHRLIQAHAREVIP
eukprot:Skav214560  [mRNA]  locus=scaffold285:175967:177181:- [translate_table: standard]